MFIYADFLFNRIKMRGKKGLMSFNNKRGQLTVFIILGIVIAVGIVLFFSLKDRIIGSSVPPEFKVAYDMYMDCIDAETYKSALLLGQSGGYLKNPDFSPGNVYFPFSSELNFMGFGIPYWYYISGNGLVKEQVPSKSKIENELDNFLVNQINSCDFSILEEQGFEFIRGDVKEVQTKVNSNIIDVRVFQDVIIIKDNSTWFSGVHVKQVQSNMGKLYELATKIYDYQKENMFLEKYGVDILRLYAPVDGVEITCSPKLWDANRVKIDLINAVEANTPQIKIKGDYYELAKEENKYFVQDIGEEMNANVNFMYSGLWPTRMEVWPSEDGLMKAEPVGLEQGLGILGFCYVPYHFVYDLGYPVLIQVYIDEELFQFPVVVYVDKNKPRDSGNTSSAAKGVPELCQHRLRNITISTYNTNLQPIPAYISFKCFDTQCNIGRTVLVKDSASAVQSIPQCVNGFIIATAAGYETKKYLLSDLTETSADIILSKKYKLDLEITSGGKKNIDYAIVTFTKDNQTSTFAYPEQKQIELSEGQYEIKLYVYSNSELTLEASTSQKCVQVASSGFLGIFGATEEKCFDLEVPEQIIDNAVSGGGKQSYYVSESELSNSKKIVISSEDFGKPSKLEDLQLNYNSVEIAGLDVRFENEVI